MEREEDINELKASIKERELERSKLPVEDLESRRLPSKEIILDKERLNLYLESQKGKFASPISVVLSHSYR